MLKSLYFQQFKVISGTTGKNSTISLPTNPFNLFPGMHMIGCVNIHTLQNPFVDVIYWGFCHLTVLWWIISLVHN